MKYFEKGGWWLPDGEEHLQMWMTTVGREWNGRLTYQRHKYEAALRCVRQQRLAIDVGGHVGLWSWPMAHDFDRLVAFEPMPAHRDCWDKNMAGVVNHHALLPFALGVSGGMEGYREYVKLRTRTPGSSGDTGIEPGGAESGEIVELRTLDSFGFDDLDFLKIDCEGYELFVLQGAVETLKRCKPCVIVEQKPETGGADRYGIGVTDGVDYLKSLGAKLRGGIQGDYILSWE